MAYSGRDSAILAMPTWLDFATTVATLIRPRFNGSSIVLSPMRKYPGAVSTSVSGS